MSVETSSESRKRRVLANFPEPHEKSLQATGDRRRHSDAKNIRRRHSIPPVSWDEKWSKEEAERFAYAEAGEYKIRKKLFPNIIKHEWDVDDHAMSRGGTDALTIGPPGSGKSNLALLKSVRLMEENDEKVVWRASTSRSEWLPFAPWACVCLPEGVDVTARFVPRNPTQEGFDIELEEIVREVVRYSDPYELNHDILKPGQFHVVYPDPKMRGLQEVYEEDDEKQYDGLEFTEDDPLNHWWFGYIHARIQDGPHHWTSVMFDEIGDIAPEAARNDEYAHYQKVELLKDCWVDARKHGLSIFTYGHSEADIHSMIRRKIRWRLTMAQTANPTNAGDVVGFNAIQMEEDIMSDRDVGSFLTYNESAFQFPPQRAPHIEDPCDMTLKVSFA
jgi:hypothetical protein